MQAQLRRVWDANESYYNNSLGCSTTQQQDPRKGAPHASLHPSSKAVGAARAKVLHLAAGCSSLGRASRQQKGQAFPSGCPGPKARCSFNKTYQGKIKPWSPLLTGWGWSVLQVINSFVWGLYSSSAYISIPAPSMPLAAKKMACGSDLHTCILSCSLLSSPSHLLSTALSFN